MLPRVRINSFVYHEPVISTTRAPNRSQHLTLPRDLLHDIQRGLSKGLSRARSQEPRPHELEVKCYLQLVRQLEAQYSYWKAVHVIHYS